MIVNADKLSVRYYLMNKFLEQQKMVNQTNEEKNEETKQVNGETKQVNKVIKKVVKLLHGRSLG